MAQKPKIIAIVGPTASGKTALSIDLAKQINGEVISADSRQIYRELNIGTGKVTAKEMGGVPHHLLDVADLDEIYTGADFTKDATIAIAKIIDNKHNPIIAGGTFFWLDMLRGKTQAAPVEPSREFRDTLAGYSNEQLFELLQQKDSRRAETIEPQNRRRLVRSLEIIHTLGHVPEQQATNSPYEWLIIGIDIEKDALREKFAKRLAGWLEQGLLAEVAQVREQLPPDRFLELGFEYTLTAEYLDKKITDEELSEKFVQKNWQYAKRQMTWLKRDAEIKWFTPEDKTAVIDRAKTFLEE